MSTTTIIEIIAPAILILAIVVFCMQSKPNVNDAKQQALQRIVEISQCLSNNSTAYNWTVVDDHDLYIRLYRATNGAFAFLVTKGDPNKRHAATIRCIAFNEDNAWARDGHSDPTSRDGQITLDGLLRMVSAGNVVSGALELSICHLLTLEGQLTTMAANLDLK